MGKITFILGGARSGKSAYALKCCAKYQKTAFIATAQALDAEMLERKLKHKNARPASWATFEEPLNICSVIEKNAPKFKALIIDCLTLWSSNLLLSGKKEDYIERQAATLMDYLKKAKCRSYVVANEVGLGIVPENELARLFRDIAGRVNQIAAAGADEVFLMAAGYPLRVKKGK